MSAIQIKMLLCLLMGFVAGTVGLKRGWSIWAAIALSLGFSLIITMIFKYIV